MKVFGFNRYGFLYIDNGKSLIWQQVTSSESEMLNRYSSIQEYDTFTDAWFAYGKVEERSDKEVLEELNELKKKMAD